MVEINSAVENPALRRAIAGFHDAPSPETEERLAAALLEACLLLPVRHAAEGEDGSVDVDVAVLHSAEGDRFAFGFTDVMALELWANQPAAAITTLALDFRAVAGLVLQSGAQYGGFVINPGNSSQHLLTTRALASYSGSAMPVLLAEQTELMLGEPSEFPEALGNAVCAAVSSLAAVRRLWLLLKMERVSGERSFLILVDITDGDLNYICDVIGRAAAAELPSGVAVELLPANSELARAALAQHPSLAPFYEREAHA